MVIVNQAASLLQKLYEGSLVPGLEPAVVVTLIVTSSGTYDPATGTNTQAETSTETQVIPRHYTMREIARSGGAIRQGDVEFKFRTHEPHVGDTVVWGTKRLRVELVRPIGIGADNLLWVATCREG